MENFLLINEVRACLSQAESGFAFSSSHLVTEYSDIKEIQIYHGIGWQILKQFVILSVANWWLKDGFLVDFTHYVFNVYYQQL